MAKSKDPTSLLSLPGVGVSIAKDLQDLGIHTPVQLKDKNAQELYDTLCKLRGTHIDRCMLYVFRCIVYAAKTPKPDPQKLLWWSWKDHT